MRKYILSFIFPLLFFTLKAEEGKIYTLRWEGISMLDAVYSDQKILSFEGSTFIDHTYLPYFVVMTDLESLQQVDSVSVINAAYVDLSADEADLIKVFSDKIKTKPQIEISYTTDRKQRKAVVTLLPVVNEQGKYRKLISFGLKYHFQTKTMLRAGKVSGTHQYAPNSVLNSGKWVKISVKESGIYKISYEDLVKWGISNPANARIFGYGGAVLPESFKVQKPDDLPQVAIWKEKGADGIFNSGDYLLFYAQGPVLWQYNSNAQIFNRSINPYSFEGYYFISSDAGVEKTISLQPAVQEQPTADITTFLDYRLHEQESRNLSSTGKDWFGEQFDRNNLSKSFSFSFPNIDTTRQAVTSLNIAGDGSMKIYLNAKLGQTYTLNKTYYSYFYDKNHWFKNNSENISVNLQYTPGSSADLNYLAVNAYRKLIMTGDAMFFRDPEAADTAQWARFHLQGQSNLKIWKINDKQNIQQLSADYNGTEYSFTDEISILNEYVAINPAGNFPTPTFAGEVANQNLHAVNQADLVVITPSEYWLQANNLAKLHQDKDGLSTLVVTTDQVYNEFSSGTPDATAYRWLMKMLYDRAATLAEAPKYLLLFGDGTYDNRSILKENIPYNKLLTYQGTISLGDAQAWGSDDYFGFLDDDEMDIIQKASLDVAIGRLPVSSSQQATDIVNKISTYLENKYKDYWKNLICYIGDDKDAANSTEELAVHMAQANILATSVENNYKAFQVKRIFYDAFTQEERANGDSYPQAKETFDKLLDSGVFMVSYTGHANPTSLSAEKILSDNDVNNMHNKKFPFLYAATCEFGRFDWGKPITAEKLLLKPDAGFIGVISASRVVYSKQNLELQKAFTDTIFGADRKPLALGEILRRAKNKKNSDENKMSYVLLGDPAITLPIPRDSVKIDTIISNSNAEKDTVNVLSTVTVTGHLETIGGARINNFNGKLYAVVYDKKMKVTELLNAGNTSVITTKEITNPSTGIKETVITRKDSIFYYYDRINVLFSGTTTVQNGTFTFQFMVPKDIACNYGRGRINLYAADTTNNLEAQGYYENFIVGGMKSDFVFENQGPTINMYLNTPRFQNGNIVDANSIFMAKLYDDNGINTTGNAIGHDLVLTLNNDKNMSYVLNNYYETTGGDYRSGTVTYKLPTLAEGNYTLTFRAWDLLNNSTTETLNFKISNDVEPTFYNFSAYPNPADTRVRFAIEHDQPSSELIAELLVYNLSGKQVFTDKKTIYSEGNTIVYDWDLVDSAGSKLPGGIYLYRLSLATDNRELASQRSKLIIK